MAELKHAGPESESEPPPKSADKVGRNLSVSILSRFMRITYGNQAITETQRRITAYAESGKFDVAEIWKRVLTKLTGYDVSAETRRIVKAKRSLKVKT